MDRRRVWIYNEKSDCAIEVPATDVVPVGWRPLEKRDAEILEEIRREKIREERELWMNLLS